MWVIVVVLELIFWRRVKYSAVESINCSKCKISIVLSEWEEEHNKDNVCSMHGDISMKSAQEKQSITVVRFKVTDKSNPLQQLTWLT
jgi:hypothetical protein